MLVEKPPSVGLPPVGEQGAGEHYFFVITHVIAKRECGRDEALGCRATGALGVLQNLNRGSHSLA